jgi:HAD superfamily hydrolase (TIGR01509 family)
MIKALIFDLDGTLANTEPMHYRSWKQTLVNYGVTQFTFETFMRFVGTSNEAVARNYIKSHKITKSVIDLVLEKQAIYLKLIPEIQLLPGVEEILVRYHGNLHLAVASSSHKREILDILKAHKLTHYFDLVIGGDMVTKRKPDPEIYLKVIHSLKVAPHECIAFEDSTHGLNSAKNAAIYSVAIPNEFTQDHDFSQADLILTSLEELSDEKIAAIQVKIRTKQPTG